MDQSKKNCRIKYILNKEETDFIKHLFKLVDKEYPESERICFLEDLNVEENSCHSCNFYFRWGNEKYCGNPEISGLYLGLK